MLFEVRDDRPQPVLVETRDGVRSADGIQYLSLAQTAARFGRDEDYWRREWTAFWGQVLSGDLLSTDARTSTDAGGAAPTRVTAVMTIAEEQVIRAVRFSHLTEPHWIAIRDECRRLGLNLNMVWVKLQTNEHGIVEPKLIIRIDAMRMVAQLKGLRANESAPSFCSSDNEEDWKPSPWRNEDRNPYAARVIVTRKDTGEQWEGIAYHKMCAQMREVRPGVFDLVECWQTGGPGAYMLGKCAAAAAHRMAYPELFAGVHTTDELRVSRNDGRALDEDHEGATKRRSDGATTGGAEGAELNLVDEALKADSGVIVGGTPIRLEGSGKLAATIPDDPRRAAELVDESTPGTLQSLERDLIVYADLSPAQAKDHIREFKSRLRTLFTSYFQGFAAVTLKAARENPQVFVQAA